MSGGAELTKNITTAVPSRAEELEQTRLIAEYQANVALWEHDDTLRQQRIGNFLGVNAALLAAVGVAAGLKPPLKYIGGVGILFALFGLVLCVIWERVQTRNAEYIRFRRFQLRSIESRLSGLSTFQNVHRAFYECQPVTFESLAQQFAVKRSAHVASTISEGHLPKLIGGVWFLTALVSAVLLIKG
jgi:hypothetical protein